MKRKLIFACRWNKSEQSSWSGSAYAVYQELNKRYCLERFDIKDSWNIKLYKLARKVGLVKGEPSLLGVHKKNNRFFEHKYNDGDCVVFQFSETPWTPYTKNYVYQDLAVEYLLYIKKTDPISYAHCGFTGVSEKQLKKRAIVQKAFYEHCDCIFTMGDWLADFLRDECGVSAEKIKTVGAGINVPIQEVEYTQKEENKILFVGRDFERKGGPIVLEAFKILKQNYLKGAELYIAGPAKNPLKKNVDGVIYLGNISTEQLRDYYKICDIFCMPSYFEPFGIVFCEALVNGLPCIGRNKFAMKEIIEEGKTGYLLEDDNVDELARKMFELLKNREIAKNVRAKREYYINKYSWSNVVDNMCKEIAL